MLFNGDYITLMTAIIGEALGMSEIGKGCFPTQVLHTFGGRAGSHWMGEVSNVINTLTNFPLPGN